MSAVEMDSKPVGIKLTHLPLAAIPLLVMPALIYATAEGWLNFGGGEKDLLLAIPYVLWATVFFVTGFVLIVNRWALRRWLRRSAILSIGTLFAAWVLLVLAGSLGVVS
jgi:hypothetical protein